MIKWQEKKTKKKKKKKKEEEEEEEENKKKKEKKEEKKKPHLKQHDIARQSLNRLNKISSKRQSFTQWVSR
jgi:hypothetical protein